MDQIKKIPQISQDEERKLPKENSKKTELDIEYFNQTSDFLHKTLISKEYKLIKIIPESEFLSRVYNSFDRVYYRITNEESTQSPALISLLFIKIEATKGELELKYPNVSYHPSNHLTKRQQKIVENRLVHFPVRNFTDIFDCMQKSDPQIIRLTKEFYKDLFVKIFPRIKILQEPLRLKLEKNSMEIDAHAIFILKKSLYTETLPGIKEKHIYFLTKESIVDFIRFQAIKYNAYITAKIEAIDKYEMPKQKRGYFGRQSFISFGSMISLVLTVLSYAFKPSFLIPLLVVDGSFLLIFIGMVLYDRQFAMDRLYHLCEWNISSRDKSKWQQVFRIISNNESIELIKAECANFNGLPVSRKTKKFSIMELKIFSKRHSSVQSSKKIHIKSAFKNSVREISGTSKTVKLSPKISGNSIKISSIKSFLEE